MGASPVDPLPRPPSFDFGADDMPMQNARKSLSIVAAAVAFERSDKWRVKEKTMLGRWLAALTNSDSPVALYTHPRKGSLKACVIVRNIHPIALAFVISSEQFRRED